MAQIKIKPLQDRVLLKDYKDKGESKGKSGIILPESVNEDKDTKKGEVVAVGPGKYDDGVLVPMTLKKGDIVVYSWGDKIKFDGEEYTIVRESDITAIIG